ncbi:MAG TPA: pyridoxal phosphate-dependent aminotransferase [Pilimelia sp.]|nr:pyridoxal phosphate-dependent aminotransferase [Pilimelia sp.]
MSVRRLAEVEPFGIEAVAAAAGSAPDVLRLENLDTDLPPPPAAVAATRRAVGRDEANSYLPFTGLPELRRAVADRLVRQTGRHYDPDTEVVISSGGLAGVLSVLLATVDAGDEVVVTDPGYAGLLHRIRLVGAIPRQVPHVVVGNRWRLDTDELARAVGPRTRVVLMVNPGMPTGALLTDADWRAVAAACERVGAWLVYDAALERIVYARRPAEHPVRLPELAERTITVGSPAKEYRMIGWRVGWIAGPRPVMADVAQGVVYNTVVPSGFAQLGVAAALTTPDDGVAAAVARWRHRRDTVLDQLRDLPVIVPEGGWCALLDAAACGPGAAALSRRLLARGRVAATPMTTWGARVAPRYLRLVFSNEPVHRLATLRDRMAAAL